jgi:predicted TIM-barrel fold metal-dependent hydrolase
MWKDSLVVDGVTHAYEWTQENRAETMTEEQFAGVIEFLWKQTHLWTESNRPGYKLNLEEFTTKFTSETIARTYIEETDVDMIVYHEVEIGGFFKRGTSPLHVGEELKRAYPERVLLYAFADPFRGEVELERMEEKVATGLVDGFKFYPTDGVFNMETGKVNTMLYDDPELAYPYLQKALDLGVKQVAVHKAFPVAPGSIIQDRVDDMGAAAQAFPDLTFEVVHAGWAFLEDSCISMQVNPNLYANLELTANYAVRRPRQCMEAIGEMLRIGTCDHRLLFASGIPNGHPQPVLEALAEMQMPEDLVEGQDLPELTDELKKKMFGENMLALHGIDPEEKKKAIAGDEWERKRTEARERDAEVTPWRAQREAAGTYAAAV